MIGIPEPWGYRITGKTPGPVDPLTLVPGCTFIAKIVGLPEERAFMRGTADDSWTPGQGLLWDHEIDWSTAHTVTRPLITRRLHDPHHH